MITKIGAATVSSTIKPVTSIKPVTIKAVEPMEKKPIMPTTQTQDVANNLRGVHEDGYDSREGFGRPDTAANEIKKAAMLAKAAFGDPLHTGWVSGDDIRTMKRQRKARELANSRMLEHDPKGSTCSNVAKGVGRFVASLGTIDPRVY